MKGQYLKFILIPFFIEESSRPGWRKREPVRGSVISLNAETADKAWERCQVYINQWQRRDYQQVQLHSVILRTPELDDWFVDMKSQEEAPSKNLRIQLSWISDAGREHNAWLIGKERPANWALVPAAQQSLLVDLNKQDPELADKIAQALQPVPQL